MAYQFTGMGCGCEIMQFQVKINYTLCIKEAEFQKFTNIPLCIELIRYDVELRFVKYV